MSALFEPGALADPERTAAAIAHLQKTAVPPAEGKQAYVVEVVEAWRIGYWVLAADAEEARQLAEGHPVHRVRQRAQRVAYEVIETALLGDWPGYMSPRRTEHYGQSSDPERDHPVPHDPRRGEFA
jgi:hypothetical protein